MSQNSVQGRKHCNPTFISGATSHDVLILCRASGLWPLCSERMRLAHLTGSPRTRSPPWQTKPVTMRWNLQPCTSLMLLQIVQGSWHCLGCTRLYGCIFEASEPRIREQPGLVAEGASLYAGQGGSGAPCSAAASCWLCPPPSLLCIVPGSSAQLSLPVMTDVLSALPG